MIKIPKFLLVSAIIITTLAGCNSNAPNIRTNTTDPITTKKAEDFIPLLDYAFDYIDYRILFTSKDALGRLADYGPSVSTFYWASMVDYIGNSYKKTLTEEETAEIAEILEDWGLGFKYNYAYNKDKLNAVFSDIYGSKRLDVYKWTHTFEYRYVIESYQYIIVGIKPKGRSTEQNQLYKITDVKEVKGLYYVTMKVLLCTPYSGAVDGSKFRDHTYESSWLNKKVYTGKSFDEAVAHYGVDESKLGTITFAIKDTYEGLRIDGLVEESDLVLPDAFGQHNLVKVAGTSDSGLKLRKGPAAEHDVITIIPEGAKVLEIGYNYGSENDWVFVVYNEYSGWSSMEYLELLDSHNNRLVYSFR